MSTVVVGWQWLLQAAAAERGGATEPFYRAKLAAAAHFFSAELPRVDVLAKRCRGDDSYVNLDPADL